VKGVPTVTVFDFDESHLSSNDLSVLRFTQTDYDWLDFVVKNRGDLSPGGVYDIVIGPVANNTIYKVVELYEDGSITSDEAIVAFKVRRLYDQVVFRSDSAIALLTDLGDYEVIK
jgi:hypothetical protein